MALQLLAQQTAKIEVDGRHDRWRLLNQRDRKAAAGERLGHLEADVPTSHDDHRAGSGGNGLVEDEGVRHGMQHLHPVQLQAVDRGTHRDRTGADDEPVIAQQPLATVRLGDGDLLAGWVDGSGGVVKEQLDAGLFQVACGAMGQVAPVGHVTRQVVGQPTDGEVGESIGDDHGGLNRWVQLAGA
jgi:hypothetical protein